MDFYGKLDEPIERLTKCEIILDGLKPERCPNRAFFTCSRCERDICYYHRFQGHHERGDING